MTDEFFMKKAFIEAQTAYEAGEIPVGAVVVMDDKVISKGHNQVELLQDCTAHAEMIALTAAFSQIGTKYLSEAVLYVTLEPCLMCCGALYWSKIGRIVYGAADEKNGFRRYFKKNPEAAFRVLHPKTKISHGVMAEECAGLMKDFFKERR